MGEFAVSIEHSEAESVLASGGRSPDQGLCPWTPLGAPPPDPRYRLALHALAMPDPKYATASSHGGSTLNPPLFNVRSGVDSGRIRDRV